MTTGIAAADGSLPLRLLFDAGTLVVEGLQRGRRQGAAGNQVRHEDQGLPRRGDLVSATC